MEDKYGFYHAKNIFIGVFQDIKKYLCTTMFYKYFEFEDLKKIQCALCGKICKQRKHEFSNVVFECCENEYHFVSSIKAKYILYQVNLFYEEKYISLFNIFFVDNYGTTIYTDRLNLTFENLIKFLHKLIRDKDKYSLLL